VATIPVRVDYNHELKPLEDLLSGVERPGDFFVSGKLEAPMPKVEVEGVGVLSFPVPAAQIKEIIPQAVRAPYGRGEDTILDTSVRNVWQLTPAKVRLGGKSWERCFQHILSAVAGGLGCGGVNMSAELYKLLVYDEGSFFKEHRDTEKSDGMFGTLVVVLPSSFWHLWQHAAEFLLARSEHPPEPPRDWRQHVTQSCRCEDCRELQSFARNPAEHAHRFRVRKDRRQHLHETIKQHGLDMTHVTERKGSPQTLVCTKTRGAYQRRCAQYRADLAAMTVLFPLVRTGGERANLVPKLVAAVGRSASMTNG